MIQSAICGGWPAAVAPRDISGTDYRACRLTLLLLCPPLSPPCPVMAGRRVCDHSEAAATGLGRLDRRRGAPAMESARGRPPHSLQELQDVTAPSMIPQAVRHPRNPQDTQALPATRTSSCGWWRRRGRMRPPAPPPNSWSRVLGSASRLRPHRACTSSMAAWVPLHRTRSRELSMKNPGRAVPRLYLGAGIIFFCSARVHEFTLRLVSKPLLASPQAPSRPPPTPQHPRAAPPSRALSSPSMVYSIRLAAAAITCNPAAAPSRPLLALFQRLRTATATAPARRP